MHCDIPVIPSIALLETLSELHIERVNVKGVRAEIGKLQDDIQGVIFDGYSRRDFRASLHDFYLLQADAKSENLTGIRETVEKGLDLVFTAYNKGSIVSKEKLHGIILRTLVFVRRHAG